MVERTEHEQEQHQQDDRQRGAGSPAFYDTATPMCKPTLAHR
jgi:hypothetical protein